MKKLIVLSFVFCLSVITVYAKKSKVVFNISNYPHTELIIGVSGEKIKVALDKEGKGVWTAAFKTAQYISTGTRKFFIEPGKDLEIFCDGIEKGKTCQFKGANAAENTYLNDGTASSQLSEAFLNIVTRKVTVVKAREGFQQRASIKDFPAAFKLAEDKRFCFRFFNELTAAGVKLGFTDDAAYLEMDEYKDYLKAYVSAAVRKGNTNLKPEDLINKTIRFEADSITCTTCKAFLMDYSLRNYVAEYGVENIGQSVALYRQYVSDAASIKKFELEYSKWSGIKSGKPFPAFAYTDVNGKVVKLSDLKGKYIYIDFWATWCGPCKKEFPYLKELEEQYKNKNIQFVGISIDELNKVEAWKQMVTTEKLGGMQLHIGADQSLKKALSLNSIPRFVLLDREGNFINSNMSRPSDVATSKSLEMLEGI